MSDELFCNIYHSAEGHRRYSGMLAESRFLH